MKSIRFYDPLTGLFSTRTLMASGQVDLAANTPPGFVAIEGAFDHMSKRVDLITGEVVDYQPPQPSPVHEWNASTKRWQLTEAEQVARAEHAQAMTNIEVSEATSLRAIRELLLDPNNKAAKDALQVIDDNIAAQRPKIRGG